jgi:hypothetical protein
MSRTVAIVCLVLLMIASGCATVVAPPPVSGSVPVYLTDYGRHSSILLRAQHGQLQEYAYGDWNWFAESRISISGALQALFASRGATLGRRQLDVGDSVEAISAATGADRVASILVPSDNAQRLLG